MTMLIRSRHKEGGGTKNQNRTVQRTMKGKRSQSRRKYRVNFAALSTCQISESVQPGEKPATSANERIILQRDVESTPYTA